MRQSDAILTRRVRSEFIKREVDSSQLEVKVIHGVAYLGGELKPSRARKILDPKKELATIIDIVMQINGIRGIDNRIKWTGI